MRTAPVQHILFDLDGTLIDSIEGIEHSVRQAVSAVLPGREVPPLQDLIGPPIRSVMQRALANVTAEQLDDLERRFRASYDTDGWRMVMCYDGVMATLQGLQDRGVQCFVVTNKPALPTHRILEALTLDRYFRDVATPDAVTPRFSSKTDTTRSLLQRHELPPDRTVLVGDSRDDAEAAAHCGLGFVAVAYGPGKTLDASEFPILAALQQFDELLTLIGCVDTP